MVFDEGTTVAGRLHPVEMPVGSGRLLPRESARRHGAHAGRQFGQCQRLHRQEGPRNHRNDGRCGGRSGRLPAQKRCFWPRPASSASRSTPKNSPICSTTWSLAPKPGLWAEAGKAIMTTDTYPKYADRDLPARRRRCDHQRHRQGRRHDRAGHGDDAVLRRDRRADRRRRRCRICCRRASA